MRNSCPRQSAPGVDDGGPLLVGLGLAAVLFLVVIVFSLFCSFYKFFSNMAVIAPEIH
jgi:hypothetical protein